MTSTVEELDDLRTTLAGHLITPADPDYDPVRAMWNAAVDRRPAAIARCAAAPDVVAALRFARRNGLDVGVRGGGHNAAGIGTCEGGVLIDLAPMNTVTVDAATGIVRCGGGARLADLDAATAEHGLAVPVGMVSETGIGGLALGGGLGWLSRRDGLTVDHLVGAEVVLADGRVVRASVDEHPDLFWALRGGGGNFGVVTEFVFRATQLPRIVQLGMTFHALDSGVELLQLVRDLLPGLSREIGLGVFAVNAPPEPFVPAEHRLRPGYALVLIGFGDPAEHTDVLERVRAAVPPLFELVTPIPFTELQKMFDAGAGPGNSCYERALYLSELSDETIAVIAAETRHKPSPLSQVGMYTLGDAYSDSADPDTAFGGSRSARYALFFVGVEPGRGDLTTARSWVRRVTDTLAPTALGGGYVNAMSDAATADARAIYGPVKHERLTRVKTAYDPDNVFHRNINITAT